jgi:chromosome segregation ATPase
MQPMAIPSLVQGMIKTEDGKVFELDSSKGSAWLKLISSFRFEPSSNSKPYTVRKESGIYWYGCRKVAGKVRKKYIGKSLEITLAKLEKIAEALEISPVPPANKVAEVAEKVTEVAQDRLTALELQVANLQKAVEALQKELSEKLESSDSWELPKVDNEVAEKLQNKLGNLKVDNEVAEKLQNALGNLKVDNEVAEKLQNALGNLKVDNEVAEKLQNALGNLKVDNEALRQELAKEKENYGTLVIISQQLNQQLEEVKADRAKLLESSTHVTNKLRQERQELLSQLETEHADREEIEAELSALKQNSAPAATLSEKLTPDAATILSQLRARRKKSKIDLADLEVILEILES